MNDSQYHQLADQQMSAIEQAIDDAGADIDYESQGGILTLEFENRSKIIINKQAPLHQLWLATKFGGYHYNYVDGQWIDDRSGDEFTTVLSSAIKQQSGEEVSF
ncbi:MULTISPECIES: iron donor protein CyaY [Corallincola]|uniref:Iron-sulfur cluster assembly protein CyaY n=3 Tax=Corallincola TaxID=1775176 RepID=A0A368N4M2_9GAMM|nr:MULTISPECIES: iron donor protein CyaY [Corallincola]RCU45507.1 iron donor protein CyaY [Corallincola holothuriorum]TAA40979.1 iron donor protein CyaY [Corallincola spongiicola]TCI02629.1 iron donor protein CyaY [Corallincola luteus]